METQKEGLSLPQWALKMEVKEMTQERWVTFKDKEGKLFCWSSILAWWDKCQTSEL